MRVRLHRYTAVATLVALCAAVNVAQASDRLDGQQKSAETTAGEGTKLFTETGDATVGGWMQAMQDQLDGLMGAVYRYGSSSVSRGFDCSGLVVYVFSKLGLPELPRSAFGMAQKGVSVEAEELQFGDLVFFNTRGRKYSHVGIYTGNGRFVHAATMNRRVMESSLSEPYYRARFNGARRMIGVL